MPRVDRSERFELAESYRSGWFWMAVHWLMAAGSTAFVVAVAPGAGSLFSWPGSLALIFPILASACAFALTWEHAFAIRCIELADDGALRFRKPEGWLEVPLREIRGIELFEWHNLSDEYPDTIRKTIFNCSGQSIKMGVIANFGEFLSRIQAVNPGITVESRRFTDERAAVCQKCGHVNPWASLCVSFDCRVCKAGLPGDPDV